MLLFTDVIIYILFHKKYDDKWNNIKFCDLDGCKYNGIVFAMKGNTYMYTYKYMYVHAGVFSCTLFCTE